MFSCSCEAQSNILPVQRTKLSALIRRRTGYHQATHSTILAVVSCHNKRAEMRTTSLASITLALRTGCNRGRPMPARDPPWGRGNARRKQASIAVDEVHMRARTPLGSTPSEGGLDSSHAARMHWKPGAGEGNRTLVCSLGSCRSTIELRPQTDAFSS